MKSLGRFSHIVSDPPYENWMHAAKNSKSGPSRIDGGPTLKSLDFKSIDEIREPFVHCVEQLCDGWLIVFCTPEGIAKWADEINCSALRYKRACVWVKPDATPQLNGQGPAQGAENIVTAWCGSGYSKWNAGGKRGVYTHLTNNKDRHGEHPTEKPVSLMMELLSDFTSGGDAVLDPFMGSGTTGVACQKLDRRFTGIEVSEKYFDIACQRIEEAMRQPDLFMGERKKADQLSMDMTCAQGN
jgi:hypothetical protein